jgi:hypothetical protein
MIVTPRPTVEVVESIAYEVVLREVVLIKDVPSIDVSIVCPVIESIAPVVPIASAGSVVPIAGIGQALTPAAGTRPIRPVAAIAGIGPALAPAAGARPVRPVAAIAGVGPALTAAARTRPICQPRSVTTAGTRPICQPRSVATAGSKTSTRPVAGPGPHSLTGPTASAARPRCESSWTIAATRLATRHHGTP